MEYLTPLEKLKHELQVELRNLSDEVDEAYEDRDRMYEEGDVFGHAQDSFDAGWERGEVSGKYDALNEILTKVQILIIEENS